MAISDMHHCITCMYINFQQNRINKSVKNVNTNLFANNRKLHKFSIRTSEPNYNLQKYLHRYAIYIIYLIFCMITSDQLSQPCRWLLCVTLPASLGQQVNNVKLHKIATCNSNFKKSLFSDMLYPTPDIYAKFEINRPISCCAQRVLKMLFTNL